MLAEFAVTDEYQGTGLDSHSWEVVAVVGLAEEGNAFVTSTTAQSAPVT